MSQFFAQLRALLSGCLVALLVVQAQAQETPKALTLGIVPQQSASRLAEEWGPLLTELSRRSGVPWCFARRPASPSLRNACPKAHTIWPT